MPVYPGAQQSQFLIRILESVVWGCFGEPPSSRKFQYDAKQPFDTTCEPIASRTDAEIQECGFTGPRGGRVNFILVKPRRAKPPYPGVIFQHGGGQSMTNYLSEALILARAGVISIIPDASARGERKNSELNTMKLKRPETFRRKSRSRSGVYWTCFFSSPVSTISESPMSATVMVALDRKR